MDILGTILGSGHNSSKRRAGWRRSVAPKSSGKAIEDSDADSDRDANLSQKPKAQDGEAVYIRRRKTAPPEAANATAGAANTSTSRRKQPKTTADEHTHRYHRTRMNDLLPSRSSRSARRNSVRDHGEHDYSNHRQQHRSPSSHRHGTKKHQDRTYDHFIPHASRSRGGNTNRTLSTNLDAISSDTKHPIQACSICLEDFPETELFSLPCTHYWCRDCTKASFKHSITTPGNISPKCCTHEIHMDDVRATFHALFRSEFKKTWRRKYAESKEPNPIYCPKAACSAWMPKELFKSDRKGKSPTVIRCLDCDCKVCRSCHKEYHGDKPCKEDSSTRKALRFIRKDSNSQLCPGCGQGVQKSAGCNHMKCVCGCDFCIKCGSEFVDNICPNNCALVSFAPDPEGDARMAQQIHEEFNRIWNFAMFDDIHADPAGPVPLAFRPRLMRFNPPPNPPAPPPPPPPRSEPHPFRAHETRPDNGRAGLTDPFANFLLPHPLPPPPPQRSEPYPFRGHEPRPDNGRNVLADFFPDLFGPHTHQRNETRAGTSGNMRAAGHLRVMTFGSDGSS